MAVNEDSGYILMKAQKDLKAICSVAEVVEAYPEWSAEIDMLRTMKRALQPIIDDIQSAIDGIGAELVKEHVQQ